MCDKFIRFFGAIHNGHANRVMTDFGLTNGYHVHDGLDQGEVFSPLLWCIFYDLFLCEVKRQKSICVYRLISHFISKTGQVESQAGLTSFLAAGAFVDDTIWVSSSQAATQHILNVASEFFCLNDISINNDKIVAIPINCQVAVPYLTISGMPISITKRGEPYHYLDIFLSSDGLLKPSLVKAHLDIWFFINLILRKVISDKQFAYLVSSVLFLIVSYKTQFSFIPLSVCNKWDALICKGLKFKSGLPLDFPNDAFHHPSLYNLKTFEQIQAESKLASVIAFANSVGVLGHLFSHRSHDLQILSWRPRHSLLFPVHVRVSSSNNFLADVVHIFSGCDLSLGGSLASAFCLWCGTSMSLVLNPHGPVFSWFDLSVHFLGGVASPFGRSTHNGVDSSYNICQSLGFGVVCHDLLGMDVTCLSVYTDGSLSNLGTVDMLAGAVVFFEDIDSGLGVGVSGLVSSILVELQAIALALECVPSFCLVDLFLDSQAAINACRLEFLLAGPNFRNCCWIECRHITNVICCKNLDVSWIKTKGHLGVSGNKHADALAKAAAFSNFHLPPSISEQFLIAGDTAVSGNSRHFMGSNSQVVMESLHSDIDWFRSSLLPVAVWKRLYNKCYLNMICLYCGDVEVSDHVFSCPSDVSAHARLVNVHASAWKTHTGLSHSSLCSISVFKDPKVAALTVIDFEEIWLVCAKHRSLMEGNSSIPRNGSLLLPVIGPPKLLSDSVVKLLGVTDAFGVSFGFRKYCRFFSGIGDMVSVHINV
ncbi:hypothetical protein G9A89_019519 [Geosiphon pyriformis]|nr:hypothetical protein G9A89_019519 [Geosiphon pyriformis]